LGSFQFGAGPVRASGALDPGKVIVAPTPSAGAVVDLKRVEELPELDSPAITDSPDVGDLCRALLDLPVKSESVIAARGEDLSTPARSTNGRAVLGNSVD
jgi:hypothetical protein